MTRESVRALLAAHRYSATPWVCSCGAHLERDDLAGHQADLILGLLAVAHA